MTSDGQVINDRYEIRQRIGRGGMADVFVARDLLLDRQVAIKVLFPEFATDPNFVERFRREAQSAANLNHPNVVGVYDWGRQASTYFMVMEFVDGRTLADILRTNGRLTPAQATDIAIEVAAALGFAHRGSVVHRDIKPANILISNDGRVKVADFGIARALNSPVEEGLTQAGSVMGTATYFSPEQAQGAQPDPRSDLYSLGCVLYEMIGGRPPFLGENPVSIAYKQVHENPQPLNQLAPTVPRPFEAIVAKLLAKNPAVRYPTAEALRDDLRRFRDGQPVAALASASATGAVPVTPGPPPTTVMAGTGPAPTVAVSTQPTTAMPPTAVAPTAPRRDGIPAAYAPRQVVIEAANRRKGYIALASVLSAFALIVGGFLLFKVLTKDDTKSELVSMPRIIELNLDGAVQALKGAGLLSDPVPFEDPRYQEGIVWEQQYQEGTQIKRGTVVSFKYNPPKNPIPVPEGLVGLTAEEAKALLAGVGLLSEQVPQESATVPIGLVISTDPPAGTKQPPATPVKVYVSAGAGKGKVPNVQGIDEATARQLILDAGFLIKEPVQIEFSESVEAGKAIRTKPAALSSIDKGTEIELFVSKGTAPIPVPKLVGLSEQQARDAVLSSQLTIKVQYQEVPFGDAQVGKVVSQFPDFNVEVEKGSEVVILVAKAGDPPPQTDPPPPPTQSTTTTTEPLITDPITIPTEPPTVPGTTGPPGT